MKFVSQYQGVLCRTTEARRDTLLAQLLFGQSARTVDIDPFEEANVQIRLKKQITDGGRREAGVVFSAPHSGGRGRLSFSCFSCWDSSRAL